MTNSNLPLRTLSAKVPAIKIETIRANLKIRLTNEETDTIRVLANDQAAWRVWDDGTIFQVERKSVVATNGGSVNVRGTGNVVINNVRHGGDLVLGDVFFGDKVGGKVFHGDKVVGKDHAIEVCAGDAAVEESYLMLVLPASYAGSLFINSGGGNVDIDAWRGAAFSLLAAGSGEVEIGEVDSETVTLVSVSSAYSNIRTLRAGSFNATLTSSGPVLVDNLNASRLILTQTGAGRFVAFAGSAESGVVSNTGVGDTNLRGSFKVVSLSSGIGRVSIQS